MERDLDPLHRLPDRLGVAQVAEHHLDPLGLHGLEPVERPALAARVVPAKGAGPCAGPVQSDREMTADEATTAGDERLSPFPGVHAR